MLSHWDFNERVNSRQRGTHGVKCDDCLRVLNAVHHGLGHKQEAVLFYRTQDGRIME